MRAIIEIFGKIDGELANHVENEISRFEAVGCDQMIFVINSSGGDYGESMRINQAISDAKDRGIHTTALVDQYCDSAATLFALMCASKVSRPDATWLIHNGKLIGDFATEEGRIAEEKSLKDLDASVAHYYGTASGRPAAEFTKMMQAETRLDAEQLLELGLIDAIIPFGRLPEEA